jgi:N-methylhydantoinase B
MVRMITNNAPKGSVLNPEPPAACGVRAATFIRLMDVVIGCLSQAQPDRLPAAGAGQACIVLLSMHDDRSGKHRVGVVQPICGGSGARPMKDGVDGMDFAVGYLRNVPAETLETDMPILIERYGLRSDSGGPGMYRGGCGIELTVRISTPDTVMTARGMERLRFQPWGRAGGIPGAAGFAFVTRDGADTPTGRIDELLLQAGDTVTFLSQGGGGMGDPFSRNPEAVLWDVRRGLVSAGAAREVYGVTVRDGQVAAEETAALRAAGKNASGSTDRPSTFEFGPERVAYEVIWTDPMQNALSRAVSAFPSAQRGYLRVSTMREAERRLRTGEIVQPDDVAALLRDIVARLRNPARGTAGASAAAAAGTKEQNSAGSAGRSLHTSE